MSISKKPINYLNNKDILKEIHESKNTYCSFLKPEYHKYDYIVDLPHEPLQKSLDLILSPSVIAEATSNKIARINQDPNQNISANTISIQDLTFRIMTWEHIPISPKQPRKLTKKITAKDIFEFDEDDNIFEDLEDPTTAKEVDDRVHAKVNFPPCQHFKIDETNTVYCVGKSHWIGDLETGEFSKDHGQITNKLAKMYMMLCEKYAMKYNYRGYTYNDEMKASAVLQLTYVGLRFNEAKSANPFAYYTAAITNSFCRVLNTEKRSQNIRDDILEMNGLSPSWSRYNTGSTTYEE